LTLTPEGRLPALDGRLRAVLIDFGGVLYRTPNPRWFLLLHRLLRVLRVAGDTDHGLLAMMRASPADSPLVMDIMTGRVSEDVLWAEAARAWRINPARLERMRQTAYTPRRLNQPLLNAFGGLRSRYKTALLTNAGSHFRRTFVALYGLEQHFDQIIISAEEGLAKPDPRIYHLAAARLSVAPGEALFIDDLPENVAGARTAGMQAVVFPGPEKAIQMLRGLTARKAVDE
jgi:putative hydrolase of the HAD superfamily